MADKLNSGDVLTNPVGNNLVVVDPNKIIGPTGKVIDRLVNPEDLIMYANLSARIYPRSKIIAGASSGDEIKVDLFEGELNFLKPAGKKFLDSEWTEAFTDPDFSKKGGGKEGVQPTKEFDNQKDFGGFGITSISVKVNASYIPQVTINFTDIRGKTLFEQARTNTPYTAFFHLPYPTFFLTLKGYYGKAVQYQLTLEKFTSRFDPGSGDYLITCDFKGNHIALLRDINMHQCVTAPYMYPTRVEGEFITSTRGRQVMKEVYSIYKKSNLIKEDFPEYTIVELIHKVKTLDNDLGRLYGEKNLEVTTHKLEYEETLLKLKEAFLTNWMGESLSTELNEDVEVIKMETSVAGNPIKKKVWTSAYPLKNIGIINDPTGKVNYNKEEELKVETDKVRNLLLQTLTPYLDKLNNNPTFGTEGDDPDEEFGYRVKQSLNDLTYENMIVNAPQEQAGSGVEVSGEQVKEKLDTDSEGNARDLNPWFVVNIAKGTFYDLWEEQNTDFEIQAAKMAQNVAAELNLRLQNYLGFIPTIRNIFAIIVAGADTYLRLLDDVHTKAMKNSTNEKRLAIANDSNDISKNTSRKNEICYPWPQYYVVEAEGDCGITSSILKYPGAADVIDITEGDNKNVWPEVEFVEEYTKSTIYRLSDYKFANVNTGVFKDFIPLSVKDWPSKTTPYTTKSNSEFLFELLDRAQSLIFYGSFMTRYQSSPNQSLLGGTLIELAGYESENINKQIEENENLQEFIATIVNSTDVDRKLSNSSPFTYKLYTQFGVVTQYALNNKTFTIEPRPNNPYQIISKNFIKNISALEKSKNTGFFDVAPLIWTNTQGSWVLNNFAGGQNIASVGDFYSIYKSLHYDVNDTGVLHDLRDISYLSNIITTSTVPELSGPITDKERVNANYSMAIFGGGPPLFDGLLSYTEGRLIGNDTVVSNVNVSLGIKNDDTRLASMLNTPYFINALLEGVTNDKTNLTNPYTKAAYLFLNSLPLITFREKVMERHPGGASFTDYVAVLFNQMPALHTVPTALLLKLGSIWWRYKTNIRTQTDPLNNIWSSIGTGMPANVYDPVGGSINQTFIFTGVTDSATQYDYISENTTDNQVQVGIYPELISAVNYIVTDSTAYTPPPALGSLNNIFSPVGPIMDSNLSITTDVDVTFDNASDDTRVMYYSVYLDSDNISDESLGIQFGNQMKPSRYFVLYPCSGSLDWTEAPSYESTFDPSALPNDTNSLHNGAARLYWKSSPHGYFRDSALYRPSPSQYIKIIDINEHYQETPWQFTETNADYSTIEELRAVFNTEQLDAFEDMFLNFSNLTNPREDGGTLKEIIKQIMFVDTTDISPAAIHYGVNTNILADAQHRKIKRTIDSFLRIESDYAHNSTNNLDMVVNNSTVLQNIMALWKDSPDYDFGTYAQTSTASIIPTTPGGTFPPTNQEFQDMQIFVGQYESQNDPQFNMLIPTDVTNPLYSFFTTARQGTEGITFNSSNIQAFAPVIRMYGTHCAQQFPTTVSGRDYLNLLVQELAALETNKDEYIDSILKQVKGKIKKSKELEKLKEPVERPGIEADDLKLDLYNSFKTMNDRWISGINLTNTGGTLFSRFLFLDRANRDIGNDAVVNIWDVMKLDSPFDDANSKTLTQSISGYLSIILANNYFNFIPLPSYINFFNVEGDNSQLQGNAMFGTFRTVDYLDSKPAFLCQYVGRPSSQLDVQTPNNGYSTDTFNVNKTANNPLIGADCGDRNLSNKVMGFNVDFGIPNQNIFESVTLDQSQYQNTAESYRILQEMANSGGGGATSMASLSLYNVYSTRSYTAKITCMGNVTIQPTQYFQLRYLPMFNGPYLIINVEHDIRPNTIETSFEGIRVPIPKLPKIDDIIQKVNESLYKEAEANLLQTRQDNYFYDSLTATNTQMKKTPQDDGYVDTGSTINSAWAVQDAMIWSNIIAPEFVEISGDHPTNPHLGIDLTHFKDDRRSNNPNWVIHIPSTTWEVTLVQDNCEVGNNSDACGKGNYIEIKTTLTDNPVDDETAYYKTLYAFLRKGVLVHSGGGDESMISRSSTGLMGKRLGKLGNTGQSKGQHLHFEIKRGVQKDGKIIEHYLNPKNFLPAYAS